MNNKMHRLLTKIFAIVTCAVCVSCALSLLAFQKLGVDAFAGIKSEELLAKAKYIAKVTTPYLEGQISAGTYKSILGDGNDIWDSSLYGVYSDGRIFMTSTRSDTEQKRKMALSHLSEVISGKEVKDLDGMVIGIPVISSYGNVVGGIFLVKPMNEVNIAIANVRNALIMCFLVSLIFMIVPVFIASNSIARPIRRMTKAALEMSVGNFKTVAEEKGRGEIALLGRSLNILSRSLSSSIGDLTAERNKLRDILDVMSDGVIAFDESGSITQYNPAAVRLLGCLENDAFDRDIMHALRIEIDKMHEEKLQSHDFTVSRGECILYISLTETIQRGSDNTAVLALIRDITAAARYEQSRKDYVANVSHELRTPLASIKSISELFCDGLIKDTERQRYYGYLLKESTRLSRLIDDLLELSGLQSGKRSFAKRRTDVYEIVMEVADRFSAAADEKGMRIETICDENISLAHTNADRAEQVLIIILDNAIKHSESEVIRLQACEDDAKITVKVSNKGHIDENDLPHLFERFYKADKSHSGQGTGLGLSIASEIMSILGEDIWVTSENDTITFCFTLSKVKQELAKADDR